MKKFLSLILALVMTCSLVACGAKEEAPAAKTETKTEAPAKTEAKADAEKPTIKLRLGHGNSTDMAVHIYTQKWADAVSEATDGRITITVYPASQLGSLIEMQEAVELGTLDMTLGDASLLCNVYPAYGLCSLAFLVDSYETAEAIYSGDVGTALADGLVAECGMRPLGFYWNGFRQILTRTPITNVAEAANIKARSPESDVYMDMFKQLGMKPTPLPWGETYTAVESGVVDGLETTTEASYTNGFAKLVGNVLISNHTLYLFSCHWFIIVRRNSPLAKLFIDILITIHRRIIVIIIAKMCIFICLYTFNCPLASSPMLKWYTKIL